MSDLMQISEVTVDFGGVRALSDVSFSVEQGEFLGLIGPNVQARPLCCVQ